MSNPSITICLSDQPKIHEYLNSTTAELSTLQTKLAEVSATIPGLRTVLARAESEYLESGKKIKADFKAAEHNKEVAFLAWRNLCNEDPAKVAAEETHSKTWKEWENLRFAYADSSEKERAQTALSSAESTLKELSPIEARIRAAEKALPTATLSLSRDYLGTIVALKVEDLDIPEPVEPASLAQEAGIIRGEIPHPCDCDAGYVRVRHEHNGVEVTIKLDDEIRHPLCNMISRFDAKWLSGAVPDKHAQHRVHSLSTWARSPIPETAQLKPLAKIPSLENDLRGWLMVGPPGASKTTYASAATIDWLTFRLANNLDYSRLWAWDEAPLLTRLNFWRIKASQWTRDMEAWETRDFGDTDTHEPSVTPRAIEQATKKFGFEPILWLEELDKFNPTTNRLRNVYSLIDAVYEANGTIISTSNETYAALEKRLGEPIYRRLSGKYDDPTSYLLWDLFKWVSKKKAA